MKRTIRLGLIAAALVAAATPVLAQNAGQIAGVRAGRSCAGCNLFQGNFSALIFQHFLYNRVIIFRCDDCYILEIFGCCPDHAASRFLSMHSHGEGIAGFCRRSS